jgi:hypothetical protein
MGRLESYWRRDGCANPRERLSGIFVPICFIEHTLDLVERAGVTLC